jgi:hypothetical protein
MSKVRVLLAATVMLGLSAAALYAAQSPTGKGAEAKLDVLVDAIRSNRQALVKVNLNLTEEEASKFWPIYDRYQKEMNAIGDRLVGVIQEYTTHFSDLANDRAIELVNEYLAVEADRIKVRRAYVDEFAKALPGRKVARFYQIENKMDAVIRYDLAATIPVVEEKRGGVPEK